MAMAEKSSSLLSSSPPHPPLPPTDFASLQSREPLSLRSSPPSLSQPPRPPRTLTSPSLLHKSSRKRQNNHLLQSEDSLPSSDPAYFSSDDIANASVENYSVERKKRRYQGCWWEHNQYRDQDQDQDQHRHRSHAYAHVLAKVDDKSVGGSEGITVGKKQQQQPKSKGFSRNFDSGVWMGSDDSEDQLDGVELLKQEAEARQSFAFSRDKDGYLSNSNALGALDEEKKQQSRKIFKRVEADCLWIKEISAEEQSAREIIACCLEHGDMSVDLSCCNLKNISCETLRPVHQLIRMPLAAFEVPVEEAYRSLKPALKLFLGNNGLSALPPELWNLRDLKALSLRNNDLKFLSPSIARLKSLRALNISANKIRYLPWEMLSLLCPTGKLRLFNMDSNYYLVSNDWDLMAKDWLCWKDYHDFRMYRTARWLRNLDLAISDSLCFVTSTPAAYFAGNGQLLPHSKQRPYSHLAGDKSTSESELRSQIAFYKVDEKPTQQEQNIQRNVTGRVPSLFELSLRSVAANCETLPYSSFPIDNDDASFTATAGPTTPLPPAVQAGLDEVRQVWNDGGRNCSVCQRPYVNPRSEWLETWCKFSVDHWSAYFEGPFYSFLRRCCGCIDPVNTFALGKAYSDREWNAAFTRHHGKPAADTRAEDFEE